MSHIPHRNPKPEDRMSSPQSGACLVSITCVVTQTCIIQAVDTEIAKELALAGYGTPVGEVSVTACKTSARPYRGDAK